MSTSLSLSLMLINMWLSYLSYFVIAKILAKDRTFGMREIAYLLGASMFLAVARTYPSFSTLHLGLRLSEQHPAILEVILVAIRILLIFFLFFYFYKLKSYSIKKAIILVIFSDLLSFIVRTTRNFIHYHFVPFRSPWFVYDVPMTMASRLLSIISAVLLTLLCVRLTKKLRHTINNTATLQTVLMLGSLVCWLMIEVAAYILSFISGIISWWGIYYTLGYAIVSIISFLIFESLLRAKYNLRQKEDEQKHMSFYLDEIEQQQAAMRKFKHDLQNLFSTLDIYIQDNDLNGLKQFYPKVRTASEIITKNEFELEGLSKIKIREIKNILISKLSMAQNLEINTRLEVGKEINEITVDTIAMVRMLGIILDNAIEELQTLGEGELYIICIKSENFIKFTIQNTCRVGMLPLKQLQQSGFSTKGDGRGLGLSNLYEIINTLPNVSLMTGIESGQFSQTLIVEGDNA